LPGNPLRGSIKAQRNRYCFGFDHSLFSYPEIFPFSRHPIHTELFVCHPNSSLFSCQSLAGLSFCKQRSLFFNGPEVFFGDEIYCCFEDVGVTAMRSSTGSFLSGNDFQLQQQVFEFRLRNLFPGYAGTKLKNGFNIRRKNLSGFEFRIFKKVFEFSSKV